MTILDEIVQYKKHLLNDGYYTNKIKCIKKVDVSYKSSLETSLKNESTLSIIAEIKSKSPLTCFNIYINMQRLKT
ncbi:indole-3-glycerol phosphate synthase [Staphylococcus hominis]